MRLKLKLKAKDSPAVIPVNYQYYFSAAVYLLLKFGSPEFSKFLHDQGFNLNGKKFKLFVFGLRLNKPEMRDGRLFSYNPKHLQKNVSFVILIKVVEEEAFNSFNCQQILHDVFTLGYGKKKSSGYGQFEVLDFSEFTQLIESSEGNSFYVLGNFLPSTEDAIIPIGYDINTKYGKFGEGLSQSENPFKNPIAFLTAGSCFKVESLIPYYGRITNESEISTYHKEMIQFGMPFTLLFNYNG